jgi:multiple sugar transport system permease protein
VPEPPKFRPRPASYRSGVRRALGRKSTVAFLMTLPLIILVCLLIIYPALYAIYLSLLKKNMTSIAWMRNCSFIPDPLCSYLPFGNLQFLFSRETFWMVVYQSCLFAVTAVIFKALIGFVGAQFLHIVPAKNQRKWRGVLLIPWVIPPAMSTLAWLWLFDPSYSAFNWILTRMSLPAIPWTGDASWARFSVILVNIWYGAPFFLIMYLAALKSVPDQLYEAAEIEGANWWQCIWFITLPMMRNIIALTVLFSLIVTFANFDIVRILTAGGPLDKTHLFSTYAFRIGIEGGDIPLGSAISLFMLPILAVAAILMLRDIARRGNEG